MTRYPTGHKRMSRRRIVSAASRVFRDQGLAGSLGRVMKTAGLTKGAFYAHFPSKSVMIAETLEDIFEGCRRDWVERLGDLEGPHRVFAMVDLYLSEEHLYQSTAGCAVPGLISDLARTDANHRTAFERYRRWVISQLANHIGGPQETAESRASAVMSLAVGALATARAANCDDLKLQILGDARVSARLLIE